MIFVIIIISSIFTFWAIYSKRPEFRGKRGEKQVRRIIGNTIEGKKYVINDYIISTDNKSSQVDHIVINPYGIFVIETKNYSGQIYGSESQLEWTQVLKYGKVKNKFYNPLKQNATHIYAIKNIIGAFPIRSLVVFVQNNTSNIVANNVIPLSDLKKSLHIGENVLSVSKMQTAYELLIAHRSEISTKEHIQNIKTQQQNLEKGICPRCGGTLTLRHGKYGEFYGCSNYPTCKFKKRI